jgi:hypothetical protein
MRLSKGQSPVKIGGDQTSPFYTSAVNVAAELDKRGVDALVLFNRFLQPTIVSRPGATQRWFAAQELKLPLLDCATACSVKADLAITSGVHGDRMRSRLTGRR